MSEHSKFSKALMVPALALTTLFSSAALADRGYDHGRDPSPRSDYRNDHNFAPPPPAVRRDWSQAQRGYDERRHDNRYYDGRYDNRYDNHGRVVIVPPPVYRAPPPRYYAPPVIVTPPVIVPAPVYRGYGYDYGYDYNYRSPQVCINVGDRHFRLNLCN